MSEEEVKKEDIPVEEYPAVKHYTVCGHEIETTFTKKQLIDAAILKRHFEKQFEKDEPVYIGVEGKCRSCRDGDTSD